MVKAIFFDVNGVLIRDIVRETTVRAADAFGLPYQKLAPEFNNLVDRVCTGEMSETHILRRLKRRHRSPVGIRELLKIFTQQQIKPRRRILIIAKRLKGNGYTVGVISDVIPATARNIQRAGVYRIFSPRILSYRIKAKKDVTKPFRVAAQRAGVKFAEMVFTDDSEKHVRLAQRLGIKAFVYKNSAQLIRSLRRFGVKI